jgi:hypothetical protein
MSTQLRGLRSTGRNRSITMAKSAVDPPAPHPTGWGLRTSPAAVRSYTGSGHQPRETSGLCTAAAWVTADGTGKTGPCSRNRTDRPRLARLKPAVAPPAPVPTTTTSHIRPCGSGGMRVSRSFVNGSLSLSHASHEMVLAEVSFRAILSRYRQHAILDEFLGKNYF